MLLPGWTSGCRQNTPSRYSFAKVSPGQYARFLFKSPCGSYSRCDKVVEKVGHTQRISEHFECCRALLGALWCELCDYCRGHAVRLGNAVIQEFLPKKKSMSAKK